MSERQALRDLELTAAAVMWRLPRNSPYRRQLRDARRRVADARRLDELTANRDAPAPRLPYRDD
jgi:hypothetical protein